MHEAACHGRALSGTGAIEVRVGPPGNPKEEIHCRNPKVSSPILGEHVRSSTN
uniref:Uncharacterized protein n=1 Tax=Ascaris lumbricoides TaxID=6252 RepID=A0A0M3IX63_ASCLU